MHWLLIAEKDYLALEMNGQAADVQYLLSVTYHNLGMTIERDAAAERHFKTQKEQAQAENTITDEEIASVLEIVSSVGAALALSR